MKSSTKILLPILSVVILNSCFSTEEFPSIPRIEYQSIDYRDTDGIDSLVLSFRFEDGDGDIGLNNEFNDLVNPYHIYSLILDADDSIVTISQEVLAFPLYAAPVLIEEQNGETQRVFFPAEKVVFSESDLRPAYNCQDYEIIDEDTFYVARNENHYNFHVDFLKKTRGEYEPIDFQTIFNSDDCTLGNFDGRIPLFDPNGNEGVITYAMLSQAFRLAFLDDTIKLRFYILDRNLNQSNIEETPDFVFDDL